MRALRRWARVAGTRLRAHGRLLLGLVAAMIGVPMLAGVLGGSPEAALNATTPVTGIGGGLCAALLASGGFGAERRTGTALLWLQKPVSPVGLYLDRFVPRLALAVAMGPLLAGVLGLVVVLVGETVRPEAIVQGAVVLGLLLGLMACVIHALSSFGLPREELLGLGVFAGGVLLALSLGGPPYEPTLARIVSVPVDSADIAASLFTGEPEEHAWFHLAWVVAYGTAWVCLGAAASLVSTRRPDGRTGD